VYHSFVTSPPLHAMSSHDNFAPILAIAPNIRDQVLKKLVPFVHLPLDNETKIAFKAFQGMSEFDFDPETFSSYHVLRTKLDLMNSAEEFCAYIGKLEVDLKEAKEVGSYQTAVSTAASSNGASTYYNYTPTATAATAVHQTTFSGVLENQIEGLQMELLRVSHLNDNLRLQMQRLDAKANGTQERLTMQICMLQNQMAEEREMHEGQTRFLQEEMAKMSGKYASIMREKQDWNEVVETLSGRIRWLKNQISAAHNTPPPTAPTAPPMVVPPMQQQQQQTPAVVVSDSVMFITQLKKKLEEVENELKEEKKRYMGQSNVLDNLRENFDGYKVEKTAQIQDLRHEIKVLNGRLHDKDDEIRSYMKKLNDMKAFNASFTGDHDKRFEELNARLIKVTEEKAQLSIDLEKVMEVEIKLTKELSNQQDAILEMGQEKAELQDQITGLETLKRNALRERDQALVALKDLQKQGSEVITVGNVLGALKDAVFLKKKERVPSHSDLSSFDPSEEAGQTPRSEPSPSRSPRHVRRNSEPGAATGAREYVKPKFPAHFVTKDGYLGACHILECGEAKKAIKAEKEFEEVPEDQIPEDPDEICGQCMIKVNAARKQAEGKKKGKK